MDTRAAPADRPPRAEGPHLPTVVWGALLVLATAACLVGPVLAVSVDLGLVLPLALVVLGALLLLTGVVAAVRGARATRRQ